MIRYVFREDTEEDVAPSFMRGGRALDAQQVGEVLAEIGERHGGKLTPTDIVKEATDPEHLLHGCFEWRDAVAAKQYRLGQARQIVRSIRVVDEADSREEPARAFISITLPGEGTSYRPLAAVRSSVDLQVAALKAAERDLVIFERRHREVMSIAGDLLAARAKLRDEIETRSKRGESHVN